MAANPFTHAIRLKVRAAGGWSVVLGRVASGESLTVIARSFGCSRHTLYKLLHGFPNGGKSDGKLWALYLEARREAASALAEEAGEIVDALAPGSALTREDVAAAKLRMEHRMRMAAAYDRETFGIQQPVVTDQVLSIGSLYLQVLKTPAVKSLPSGPVHPVQDAVIEEPHND